MAKTEAVRQKERDQRIKDAKLVQRKVVGHPDHFDKIRKYAEKLYTEEGFTLK